MTHRPVAFLLLLSGLVTHYAWQHVDPHLSAEAWNIGGALGRLVLLLMVCAAWRSVLVGTVALWWCFEELQVVVCGVAWVIEPWQVQEGSERCSAWLQIPMGLVGLFSALLMAGWIYSTKGVRGG